MTQRPAPQPTAPQLSGPQPVPDLEAALVPAPVSLRDRLLKRPRAVMATAAIVIVVLIAGGGAYAIAGGDDEPPAPVQAGATMANQLFTAGSPAAPPNLAGLAATGNAVAVVGEDAVGGQFLTSADGGRAWRVARVRAPDGDEPSPDGTPRFIAAGGGRWAALGTSSAVWTSADGATWVRRPASSAFAAGETVKGLAWAGPGFVAVGAGADGRPVTWASADGASWQRTPQPKLGTDARLGQVAGQGSATLVRGTVTVTKTIKKKKKKRKVRRTVEAFWRSADGGRTWARAAIPSTTGALGSTAITAGPGGFTAVREVVIPKKKKKKGKRYAAVFGSKDGARWSLAGELPSGVQRLTGSAAGLAVQNGSTMLRSADGKKWQRAGDSGDGERATVTPAGIVVAGSGGKLSLNGKPVDLKKVPGAVRTAQTVAGVMSAGGQSVAVGSANGDAAIWHTLNGSLTERWSRAQSEGAALTGSGQQRLSGLARGPKGWIATGRDGDAPLVVSSDDGGSWTRATGDEFSGDDPLIPYAAAYGKGYVVVGERTGREGSAPVVWTSADLKSWQRTEAGDGWMRGVATTGQGYVAVGGRAMGKTRQPVVWLSADGNRWTPAVPSAQPKLPSGMAAGALERVVSKGGTLVATGSATKAGATEPRPFAIVSADSGRTWRNADLPDAAAGTLITAAVATPNGVVLAGAIGTSGRYDVGLWSSADGRSWRMTRPKGTGLDGRGAQRLDGLTVVDGELVAVGSSGDHRTTQPTFWNTALP